jgi:hypothetical protein
MMDWWVLDLEKQGDNHTAHIFREAGKRNKQLYSRKSLAAIGLATGDA